MRGPLATRPPEGAGVTENEAARGTRAGARSGHRAAACGAGLCPRSGLALCGGRPSQPVLPGEGTSRFPLRTKALHPHRATGQHPERPHRMKRLDEWGLAGGLAAGTGTVTQLAPAPCGEAAAQGWGRAARRPRGPVPKRRCPRPAPHDGSLAQRCVPTSSRLGGGLRVSHGSRVGPPRPTRLTRLTCGPTSAPLLG